MDNKRMLAVVAAILTSIIWGLSFLSIKVTVMVLPPMTLALSRFLLASVLLMMAYKFKVKDEKVEKKDLPMLALAGLLGVTIYFYFENNGVKLISASAASIIVAAIPIFTLIAETIIFEVRLTYIKTASVLVSFVGVYFIVGSNVKGLFTSDAGKGYLMMFGAVLAWVGYCILTKPLFEKYSQLTIVSYQTLFGTIFLVPFALFETVTWNLIDSVIVLNVIYLGVLCSALAYYLYAYAMDFLGVSVTSLFLNLIPVVTVIGSYFLLNEGIVINQIIGGVLVILAVYLMNWEENSKKDKNRIERLRKLEKPLAEN